MNPNSYDLTTKQGKTDFINNAMIMRMLHGDKGINKTVVMTMLTKNRVTTAGLRKLEQLSIRIEDNILPDQKPLPKSPENSDTKPQTMQEKIAAAKARGRERKESEQSKSGQYSKKVFGAISKIRNLTNNVKVNVLMAPMFWFDEEYKEDVRKVKEARKNNSNPTTPKDNKPNNSNDHGNDRMMND
jgi:hypothetical protein